MRKIGLSQTQTSAVSEHANKIGVIFCSGMIIERGAYRQQVMLLDVLKQQTTLSVIAKPGINKRECQEFSYLSKIPAPPQGFLSGHTNTEKKLLLLKK